MMERLQGMGPSDFAKRRAWADKTKAKHHLTGLPNKMEVLRMLQEVDSSIAVRDQRPNDHHIEVFWRTASGFGHGRQWATLNLLVRDEVTPLRNATATVKISNTESRVLSVERLGVA